jgi:hypothetical protein
MFFPYSRANFRRCGGQPDRNLPAANGRLGDALSGRARYA